MLYNMSYYLKWYMNCILAAEYYYAVTANWSVESILPPSAEMQEVHVVSQHSRFLELVHLMNIIRR